MELKRTGHSGDGQHSEAGSILLVPPLGYHHRGLPVLRFQGRQSLLEGAERTRKPRALFQVTSGPNQSDFIFENEILVPSWIQKEYSFPGLFLEYPWHVEIS